MKILEWLVLTGNSQSNGVSNWMSILTVLIFGALLYTIVTNNYKMGMVVIAIGITLAVLARGLIH